MTIPPPEPGKRSKLGVRGWSLLVLAVLLLIGGPLTMIGGSNADATTARLRESGTQVSGSVVDFNDAAKGTRYRKMTVEYAAADGATYTVVANVGDDQHPKVGDRVTVRVDANSPKSSLVEGYEPPSSQMFSLGLIFTCLGVFLVALSFAGRRYLGWVRKQYPGSSR